MLIFQRRTLIGRSLVLSRISFNKPAITRLVAKKPASETCLAIRKQLKSLTTEDTALLLGGRRHG